MTDYRAAALDYLRYVLIEERETPSSLAKRVGISSTTLTRPLNSADHRYVISMSTLEKIAKETGIDPAPFIQREMNTLERTLDFFRSADYEPNQEGSYGELKIEDIVVVGEVQLGHWFSGRFFSTKSFGTVGYVPSDPEKRKKMMGVLVKGRGCDAIARDGEVALCVLRDDSSEPIISGYPVVVERHLKSHNVYEVSIRMPRLLEDGTTALTIHSTDPHLNGYDVAGETDEEFVRVIADVDMIIRNAQDADIYEEEVGQFVRAKRLAEIAILRAQVKK